MPPMITFAQPPAQLVVHLSKLVKEVRLLGYETFFATVDAIVAKNWLKIVSDTLIDMELDDELKLRVTTKLIDKSATTWWDNLKLTSITPITWISLFKNSTSNLYTFSQKLEEVGIL